MQAGAPQVLGLKAAVATCLAFTFLGIIAARHL
jgi:hypothetical protein